MDHPLGRVEEYIDIVRAAMARRETEFYQANISPRKISKWPLSRRVATMPIYFAAFGPQDDTAGRAHFSDGVLINMANPAEIRRIADEVRAGREAAGKDPAQMEIICKIRCSIAHELQRRPRGA